MPNNTPTVKTEGEAPETAPRRYEIPTGTLEEAEAKAKAFISSFFASIPKRGADK